FGRAAARLRAARHLPAAGEARAGRGEGAPRVCQVAQAGALRPQSGGDRRGFGGPGGRLHRRGDQGEGDAGGEAPDGRRLPEYRLRPVEGAVEDGESSFTDTEFGKIR